MAQSDDPKMRPTVAAWQSSLSRLAIEYWRSSATSSRLAVTSPVRLGRIPGCSLPPSRTLYETESAEHRVEFGDDAAHRHNTCAGHEVSASPPGHIGSIGSQFFDSADQLSAGCGRLHDARRDADDGRSGSCCYALADGSPAGWIADVAEPRLGHATGRDDAPIELDHPFAGARRCQ